MVVLLLILASFCYVVWLILPSLYYTQKRTSTPPDTPPKKQCQFVIKIVNNVCNCKTINYIYMVDVQDTNNQKVIYTMMFNELRHFVLVFCATAYKNEVQKTALKPSEINV